jgi:hypothetical protein
MLAPGKIYIGTQLRLEGCFEDSSGSLVDPDTIKFLTYSPSGAKATYTFGTDSEVAKVSTGIFAADIEPDEAGRWHYRWKTTGTGTTIAFEGSFLVQESAFFDPPIMDFKYR